jgi:hypothetical protein
MFWSTSLKLQWFKEKDGIEPKWNKASAKKKVKLMFEWIYCKINSSPRIFWHGDRDRMLRLKQFETEYLLLKKKSDQNVHSSTIKLQLFLSTITNLSRLHIPSDPCWKFIHVLPLRTSNIGHRWNLGVPELGPLSWQLSKNIYISSFFLFVADQQIRFFSTSLLLSWN